MLLLDEESLSQPTSTLEGRLKAGLAGSSSHPWISADSSSGRTSRVRLVDVGASVTEARKDSVPGVAVCVRAGVARLVADARPRGLVDEFVPSPNGLSMYSGRHSRFSSPQSWRRRGRLGGVAPPRASRGAQSRSATVSRPSLRGRCECRETGDYCDGKETSLPRERILVHSRYCSNSSGQWPCLLAHA